MYRKKLYIMFCIACIFSFFIILYNVKRSEISGIVINEVCNNNFSNCSDISGNYFNWIELYNMDTISHSLKGYSIMNSDREKKYEFGDIQLKAKEYLIVFFSEEKVENTKENLYADFPLNYGEEVIYLMNDHQQVVDMIEIPLTDVNQVYARIEDGGENWQIQKATPFGSNNNQTAYAEDRIDNRIMRPEFSVESGFYDEAFYLYITASDKVQIYYTLDGSMPDETSFLYNEAIYVGDVSTNPNVYSLNRDTTTQFFVENQISMPEKLLDKAFIIRAVCIDQNGRRSNVNTATYFVGYQSREEYKDFAVISLVTDPDNLFGYEKGIYVAGKIYDGVQVTEDWLWQNANYRQSGRSAERDVYIDFFDEQHNLVVSKECGMRIRGKATRAYLQKSFNLYARSEYDGAEEGIEYDFWGGKGNSVREFSLSSGGNDIQTRMKDYIASIVCEEMNFSVLRHRPCAVFLDGEYWGLYFITEKYNAEYINRNYGIPKEDVVMIRNWDLKEGEEDDLWKLHEDMKFIGSANLTIDENYKKVQELIDIDSLLDYYAFQIYIARRGDWLGEPREGGNWGVWKTKRVSDESYGDGKWRWLLFDVNSSSMDDISYDTFAYVENKSYYNVFPNLMTNPDFNRRFREKIDNLGTVIMRPDKMSEIIDHISSQNRQQVLLTYNRYFDGIYTDKTYNINVEGTKNFFNERYQYITEIMQMYIE